MKKITTIGICMLLAGCALFQSPERPGYQAGRTTTVIWLATEDVIPNEIYEAGSAVYEAMKLVYGEYQGDTTYLEQILIDQIGANTPAAEVRLQLALNLFRIARTRLENQIQSQTPVEAPEVVANFLAGVHDALELYSRGKPISVQL